MGFPPSRSSFLSNWDERWLGCWVFITCFQLQKKNYASDFGLLIGSNLLLHYWEHEAYFHLLWLLSWSAMICSFFLPFEIFDVDHFYQSFYGDWFCFIEFFNWIWLLPSRHPLKIVFFGRWYFVFCRW